MTHGWAPDTLRRVRGVPLVALLLAIPVLAIH
jgi:hypothetical protein